MTYRAFVESQQKSPMKRRRMLSSSDAITQEVRAQLPARPCEGEITAVGGGSSTPSKPPSSLCEIGSFLLNSLVYIKFPPSLFFPIAREDGLVL